MPSSTHPIHNHDVSSVLGERRRRLHALAAILGLGACLTTARASADKAATAPHRGAPQQRSAESEATGYEKIKNPARSSLIIAGAATLGTFWTASAMTAGLLQLRTSHPASGQAAVPPRREQRSSSDASLLIPLVGPFVKLGTSRHSAAGAVGLTVLGVGQAVGLGMLIGGLAQPMELRVKTQHVQVSAAPMFSPDGVGLSIQGSM